MKRYQIFLMLITLFFSGCIGFLSKPKVDISNYQNIVREKVVIPEVCKPMYKSKGTRVAVIHFTNNSTFGKANSRNYNSSRTVDSKISKSLVPVLENIVSSIVGATLYTRDDIDKIESEQKFQDSGLVDDSTLVEFGELIGVRYILTGSLDNVKVNNRDYSALGNIAAIVGLHSRNTKTQIAGVLTSVASHFLSSTNMDVSLTIKMLDVQTGQILFTKQVNDDVSVGQGRRVSYDVMIGAIKSAAIKAMPQVKEDLAKMFELKGYITKIKRSEDDFIAQINLGSKDGVQSGDEFDLYVIEENVDPMSEKKSCEIFVTKERLVISNQVGHNYSWGVIEGDVSKVKIYQIVKRRK